MTSPGATRASDGREWAGQPTSAERLDLDDRLVSLDSEEACAGSDNIGLRRPATRRSSRRRRSRRDAASTIGMLHSGLQSSARRAAEQLHHPARPRAAWPGGRPPARRCRGRSRCTRTDCAFSGTERHASRSATRNSLLQPAADIDLADADLDRRLQIARRRSTRRREERAARAARQARGVCRGRSAPCAVREGASARH